MIVRLIFFFFLAILTESVFSAGAAVVGLASLPFAFIPVAVAYGAFFQLPFEAILTAALVGFVVDCLSGSPIGLNMLAHVILWLICGLFAAWIGKPRWVIMFGFVILASFIYRILLIIIGWGFSFGSINFEISTLLFAPLLDGIVGYFLLRGLIGLLTKAELGDLSLVSSQQVRLH